MSATLATRLRRYVSATARFRGESYLRSGRVSVIDGGPVLVVATVRGTSVYRVTLRLDGDRLVADCSCPYFERSLDPCKHIWAVILAVDHGRLLTPPAGLRLHVDDGGDSFGLDDDLDEGLDQLGDELDEEEMPDLFAAVGAPPERLTAQWRRTVSERMKRYWKDRRPAAAAPRQTPPLPPPAWKVFLSQVGPSSEPSPARALAAGEILYVVDIQRSIAAGGVLIELTTRQRKKSGEWAKPKPVVLPRVEIARLPELDRRILATVCGADPAYAAVGGYGGSLPVPQSFALNLTLQRDLVPQACDTGRLVLRVAPSGGAAHEQYVPVEWDPDPSEFVLRIGGDTAAGYTLSGAVRSHGRDRSPADALFITGALILWGPDEPGGPLRFARFDPRGGERWLRGVLDLGPVTVPASEAPALLERLAESNLTQVECPEELRIETAVEPPRPIVRIVRPNRSPRGRAVAPGGRLEAHVSFAYGDREADAGSPEPVLFDRERRRTWRRDREAESAAMTKLQTLGVRSQPDWVTGGTRLDVAAPQLPMLVRTLLAEGWHVETDGQVYRRPGAVTLDVRSGIDWFELHGSVDFGGVRADLPSLLAAARRGDAFVALDDGTLGQLPDDWLAQSGRIAAMGAIEADHVRFARSQTALLDAWLATQPEVSCDAVFEGARAELARFTGIAPLDPPPSFKGVLRDYQRDALGWFEFLRRFGFGGCLADEMGLGKTVMVLAALDARRLEHERAGHGVRPSLVVVPRSLVFNWRQEAERFAPALRLLDFTHAGRRDAIDRIADHDVVLTTYGTLRRDIGELKEIVFDYAILDEAQAIKNARTGSAKAVRLVQAGYRLALSGTPVENHLGELWSLFDVLNPGMLGAASIFSGAGGVRRTTDEETLAVLARGLRPFILRRTKDQVAAELPPRTEQTLYCDLEPAQRLLYDELRHHYRAELLKKVARDGLGRAKLQVLEALLRLRQAACHPGLIDRSRAGAPAAKLDMLVPRLQELVEDGRKVLVFSQFTSLLGLLRPRLDEAGLSYTYLDGRTKDRAARVRQFQENGCPLFLISLKAGGLGLNLTAAEYVFLLDPWWNPAVEAQAIDRAHRIGQTRPVFAFRLIARDTVEEKVLELQATKRRLAEAIVRADESLIRDLRREDLELLLS